MSDVGRPGRAASTLIVLTVLVEAALVVAVFSDYDEEPLLPWLAAAVAPLILLLPQPTPAFRLFTAAAVFAHVGFALFLLLVGLPLTLLGAALLTAAAALPHPASTTARGSRTRVDAT